jgi:hypothetical protein
MRDWPVIQRYREDPSAIETFTYLSDLEPVSLIASTNKDNSYMHSMHLDHDILTPHVIGYSSRKVTICVVTQDSLIMHDSMIGYRMPFLH